jgi:uncharacterized protein YcbX
MIDPVISQLVIYPIKGCAGIYLDKSTIGMYGLKGDRDFVIVDQSGQFLTQRQFPSMACIQPKETESGLLLYAPGMEPLQLDKDMIHDGSEISVSVWGESLQGADCGDTIADWFSTYVQFPCRLARRGKYFTRYVQSGNITRDIQTSFSDSYPILLVSEDSLFELEKRAGMAIPKDRFRANIIIRGMQPFAEDNWEDIMLSSYQFKKGKPCSRCIVTTIDQSTGIKMGDEPLKTLNSFRKDSKGKVLFGVYIYPVSNQEITISRSFF